MKTYATLRFKGCFYKARFMFPVWECLIPRLGILCSQRGNMLFP